VPQPISSSLPLACAGTNRTKSPLRRRRYLVLAMRLPTSRAVEVVVLVIAQGPEEAEEPDQAEKQSQRNEIDQHRHAATSAGDGVGRAVDGVRNARGRARTALTVTVTDETDMATAAISGVTTPNTASGTAAAL